MSNEIEQIAQQNDMSIEFVTWFFNEKKVVCGNVWFMMMAAMWEGWKGRSIEMDKLATENVALKAVFSQGEIPSEAVDAFMETAVMDHDWNETSEWSWVENETEVIHAVLDALKPETPATDRIVAGFKADGVAEREKTITFTAAKKRTQDGVALIAIGKPYKIHNDDVIGEFFIGESGRYGVITMDRLDYFTMSDEYVWEFSLREGDDK
ncbi:hypothetical protein AAHV15_09000 [Klebsiella pneumoniae]